MPAQIINADETMVLRIKIVTSLVTSELFSEHTKTGLRITQGNTAPIGKEIDQFLSTFSGEIKDGDLFEIVYAKGIGVQTFKNGGREPIVTIPGMPIKSALFGIWLASAPKSRFKSWQMICCKLRCEKGVIDHDQPEGLAFLYDGAHFFCTTHPGNPQARSLDTHTRFIKFLPEMDFSHPDQAQAPRKGRLNYSGRRRMVQGRQTAR